MCVLSVKVPIRKKSGNLFNDPRIVFDPSVLIGNFDPFVLISVLDPWVLFGAFNPWVQINVLGPWVLIVGRNLFRFNNPTCNKCTMFGIPLSSRHKITLDRRIYG